MISLRCSQYDRELSIFNIKKIGVTSLNEKSRLVASIKGLESLLEGKQIDFNLFKKNTPRWILYSQKCVKTWSVFRASVLGEEEATKPPLYVDRFSYPDPNKGIKVTRGRANIAGAPVFYCSNSPIGAIDETLLTKSDFKRKEIPKHVFLSEWYCENAPMTVYDLKFRFLSNMHNIDVNELDDLNTYLKLISKAYLSNSAYDFTSEWSDYLFNHKNRPFKYDMIVYKSTINKRSENYAIHPESIKKYYKLRRVVKIGLPNGLNPNAEKGYIQTASEIGFPDESYNILLSRKIRPEDLDIFFSCDKNEII